MEKIKNLATEQSEAKNIEPIEAEQKSAIFEDAERQAINEQARLGLETDKIEKEPDDKKRKLKNSMCIALAAFTFFAAAEAHAGQFENRVGGQANNSIAQTTGRIINEAGNTLINFLFHGGKTPQQENDAAWSARNEQNKQMGSERDYENNKQRILVDAITAIEADSRLSPQQKAAQKLAILNSLKNLK